VKMFVNDAQKSKLEGGIIHMMKEHRGPGKHMTPHERKALMHIEFDGSDWNLFHAIYSDEDEAMAAIRALMEAPPEIQILAIQLINLIEEGA